MKYRAFLLVLICVIILGCLPEEYTNPIITKDRCIVDDELFGMYKVANSLTINISMNNCSFISKFDLYFLNHNILENEFLRFKPSV